MSMDLNENSLKEADFLSNNPERHNSDSSVEFLMAVEKGQEVNLVLNREPEQSSAQTNNATQQVVKTTFSTKETLDTIGNKTSDIDDFIPLIRTDQNGIKEYSAEIFEKREKQNRCFILNSTIVVGVLVVGGLLYKFLLAKR